MIYDLVSSLLALIVSIILIIEFSFTLSNKTRHIFSIVDNIILIIFAIDYFVRFYLADDKRKFFKRNIQVLFQLFFLLKNTKQVTDIN
ncbi:ion transporter [Clostridium felsineum]|uniref:ion transporter n=1 Tax=Clostridium felsineum TaxID=36839 RepID=UPI00358DD3BA